MRRSSAWCNNWNHYDAGWIEASFRISTNKTPKQACRGCSFSWIIPVGSEATPSLLPLAFCCQAFNLTGNAPV